MEPRLPYDILLQIFHHLDPLYGNEVRLRDTPSSVLAIQHSLGATLSQLSRDWRDVGVKYLWSSFILSFATDKSRRKLGLIIGNEEVAKNVKRLFLYAGVHDVERAAGLPIDFVLPSLPNLYCLELSTNPSFAMKAFSQVDLSSGGADLRNLRHLLLDSSDESSIQYPEFLLRLVSRLPLLESLDITISLPSTGILPALRSTNVHSRPLQKLKSLHFLVCGDNSGPSQLANPFLDSLLNHINPSPLETLSITCRTLPDSLSTFLASATKLSKLNLTCDRITMENQLGSFVSSFSTLSNLSKLEFGILPAWTAPFHFLSTSPIAPIFFSSLAFLPRLRSVSLDFDLSSHELAIVDFLKNKWEEGVFERFEWNSWMSVSRYSVPISYERRKEGGWRREEQGHSLEVVGE